ncbi:hypothetical protein CBR_g31964 [Chara braunii]|uniref:DUF659 domain-containing protein n=1 Tax=Chara braunii TaxID=69332 RepID=A0A388LG58_CHABU|nr:hypothetical protein CBR_g31964 [Chara braunii]|eukprot:GBG81289.1 hypothetical protein CBR_g31964 [Chara braunii]
MTSFLRAMDVFVDLWNHTDYEFEKRHHRGIVAYMREHDIVDRGAVDVQRGSGRGRTGASQSQAEELDPVDEVERFLDEQAKRAEVGEGGGTAAAEDLSGEEVVMTARGRSAAHHHKGDSPGPAGKRPVGSGVEGVPQAHKRQRQSTLDEVYDPDGQAAFRDTFLQWCYDSGIPFAAFRRPSWYRHKKALAAMSRGVRPVYPSFKDIGDGGIDDQRGKVAAMLREVRASFESVGATILSDGRQPRDARPIVNFLAAAKRGALLYATVQRDGSVAETAWIVLRRWKAIFRSFPPKDVLGICTDSASNYTSAAKLLAKDPDPEIRRITWLPCATHVANLMLSDISTGVPWVTETIVRARALVRFIKSHGAAYHLFRVKSRRCTLVHLVGTRFASVFFMFVCLLARRNALESMLHDDEWDKIPWESPKRRQALWVRQVIRCADFWRNVQYAVSVMTPVHQLLRRLDRGGMIMSMMYSWSQELARQVAAVDVPDDMRRPCVEAVQIRTMHMLEPAHAAAHLLNPRRRSLRYYESARRTVADLEVVTECDSFFLAQTGDDAAGDAYLRVRQQMRSFHSRVGHMTDRVTRDAEAEAYVGDEETSRCASWWVEHGACFADLQEIAGRVMHMWTSASPAERNWAEHERIQTAKRNKLKFRKVAQLVEIATNLKLLGCSNRSGGYVLPWGHMSTLAEARPDEYTHTPTTADRDEEEEPEPEEWGARPQSAVAAHETSEQESDSEDWPPGVDKSAERLYYTYGAGPDGFQPHCTVIQESDDDSVPASGGGTGGPTGRAARGASGGATGGPSGGATHGKGGRTLGRAGAAVPAQPTAEREGECERAACTDDDDDELLVFHRARMASDRAPSATEGLRRSVRLQTLADSSTGARREVSDHLDDIAANEHMPSEHTPASAPPGDREQTDLRTSDFPRFGHGCSDTGLIGRGHRGERVGDDIEYCPTEASVSESTEELHARLHREEEQQLEVLQRQWAGRAAYVAEQQCARDLETGAAVPDPGGVEHHDPTAPHPFAAYPAQTEEHGDPTVPEHGDPAVSDVVLGFRAADTLQPDDVRTEEAAVRMEGDSDEHWDEGLGPGEEADDGADTAGRLSPSPSAGPGPLSHGPIGGDDMDLQGDDPEEVGGSMSLALVLWDPSPVAHDVPSEHVEGGGGADEEEEEGGIPPHLHDHASDARADMEEGGITPGPLDPDALQHALVEDPISRGVAGSLGVGVRSPPLYTPVTPRYSGSPASLERDPGCTQGSHHFTHTSIDRAPQHSDTSHG